MVTLMVGCRRFSAGLAVFRPDPFALPSQHAVLHHPRRQPAWGPFVEGATRRWYGGQGGVACGRVAGRARVCVNPCPSLCVCLSVCVAVPVCPARAALACLCATLWLPWPLFTRLQPTPQWLERSRSHYLYTRACMQLAHPFITPPPPLSLPHPGPPVCLVTGTNRWVRNGEDYAKSADRCDVTGGRARRVVGREGGWIGERWREHVLAPFSPPQSQCPPKQPNRARPKPVPNLASCDCCT